MKNFVDWLTGYLSYGDYPEGFQWTKEDTIKTLTEVHQHLLSENDLPYEGRHYGDCTNENVSCIICEYQNWLQGYEDYCRTFK
jgi:hypothetical protein